MTVELKIRTLGAQGDGIAEGGRTPLFVPFALEGETVSVRMEGHGASKRVHLEDVITPSPLRIEPACVHFGSCGGCAMQHLEQEAYRAWKREKVVHALTTSGLTAEVDPIWCVGPASRRRITLSALRAGGTVQMGFAEAGSHRIVDLKECPVAAPEIMAALSDLRDLAALFAGNRQAVRFTVTVADQGLDVAFDAVSQLDEGLRQKALRFALERRLLRLSVGGDVIVTRDQPAITFGVSTVHFPPGAFLQASREAEAEMARLVSEHLSRSKYVADLFAGCGTFGLRLGMQSRVHAVEGDALALAALDGAARAASGLKPVTAERRDLFRRPLSAKELNEFDGVVIDPPRAGAEDQCVQIARSTVKRVAAVSCNPGTLARDLKILVDGGYKITRIVPIDQFLWTPHVEVVALLEKSQKRR